VVGVANDARVRSLGGDPELMVYLPYSQAYAPFLTVLARTAADPEQTALALMTAAREVDPDFWAWETKILDAHLGIMLLPAQLSAFLLSVFAVLALVLSSIGLYGVVSYAVAQRTREVGIRMALGADRDRVVRLLAASGLRLVAVGTAIGLVASLALARLLSDLLFGVETLDLTTFVAVPVVLGLTAVIAAYLPARRAARLDPVTALRTE
jgi:putative ABC transport system permease protein